MTHNRNASFFSLPPELHTHIFTLACTPNPTRECATGPSYYTACYTGIALSLVCKYVRAASAPARHRAVVIYGWREMLAFERILSSSSHKSDPHSRVRYLTLVADELPQDPISLFSDHRDPLSTTALSPRSSRLSNKTDTERKLLDIIARILRSVGNDLYELEIGFQAIEHVKDPLAYLSLIGPAGQHSPLFFPCLDTMFFACPPSNAFPWGMTSKLSSIPAINSIATASQSSTTIPVPPNLSCPCLKELTVVCNDSCSTFQNENVNDQIPEDIPEESAEENADTRESTMTEETQTSVDADMKLLDAEMNTNKFPSLITLTLLASTPAQALAALDIDEAAWDVGSNFRIDVNGLRRNITSTVGSEDQHNSLDGSETGGSTSEELQTVILRPKTRWNERWESLRDVARRQREEKMKSDDSDDDRRHASQMKVFVLKPGEQL